MPNITPINAQKSLVMNSQGKLITIEKINLDIGKQMLETNYTVNLGKLLIITPKQNKYFWQKLNLKKTQNVNKATIMKQVGSLVPEVRTVVVVIDSHMEII